MANTPQAKKRIRRNANRAEINHSRVSRIRTFIKAVEVGDCVGQEGRCRRGAEEGPAGDRARRCPRRHPQEHGVAEDFAPVQAGRVARLNFESRFRTFATGCRATGGPFLFATSEKM